GQVCTKAVGEGIPRWWARFEWRSPAPGLPVRPGSPRCWTRLPRDGPGLRRMTPAPGWWGRGRGGRSVLAAGAEHDLVPGRDRGAAAAGTLPARGGRLGCGGRRGGLVLGRGVLVVLARPSRGNLARHLAPLGLLLAIPSGLGFLLRVGCGRGAGPGGR